MSWGRVARRGRSVGSTSDVGVAATCFLLWNWGWDWGTGCGGTKGKMKSAVSLTASLAKKVTGLFIC